MSKLLDHKCASRSTAACFGILDDTDSKPCFIVHDAGDKWTATVLSSEGRQVELYAIDNCPSIVSVFDNNSKRCDGLLVDGSRYILIELKERNSSGWFSDGKQQIVSTLGEIERLDSALGAKIRYAYVCNNRRPKSHSSRSNSLEEFKKRYGVILRDSATIDLDKLQ